MVVWLLWMCNSMTSITCFVMAGGLLVCGESAEGSPTASAGALSSGGDARCFLFAVFFDSSGGLVQDLGRNPTLTGRTAIWEAVLPMAGDPLIGTGYESFWLGKRLEKFWSVQRWGL